VKDAEQMGRAGSRKQKTENGNGISVSGYDKKSSRMRAEKDRKT
jgi:hypothetical protein